MRPTRFLRVLPAAAVLAAVLLGVPASAPAPVAGVGPLPDCRLDDILTEPRGYDDWATTQVDWILSLGPDYKPPDLVPVRESGIAGSGYIRAVALDDLTGFVAAARKNGTPLVSWSAYRSYKQQVKLFNGYAGWTGTKYTNFEGAINFSARPGHSEHQTGLTIDFVAVGDDSLTSNWEVTRTGRWVADNAWKYGWLMSYPKGKQDQTCYRYEPWHYRYVGRELAKEIRDSGLTIREYLWANYTQVDPACVALPAPKLETPGNPRSCAFAEASPSPTTPPTSLPPTLGPAFVPSTGPSTAPGLTPTPSQAPDPGGASSDLTTVALLGAGVVVLAVVAALALGRRLTAAR